MRPRVYYISSILYYIFSLSLSLLLCTTWTWNHSGTVMNQKADIYFPRTLEGWVWELLSAFRLMLAEMFGGRRYWQGNGGVYKGCCFPWDTWRACFPATACWKSFHGVHRQTENLRRHLRLPEPPSFLKWPKFCLLCSQCDPRFSFIFHLHLNCLINSGQPTTTKKPAWLLVDICVFFLTEPPALTAQPPTKISADLDRNIDIPCQAAGNALHTLF